MRGIKLRNFLWISPPWLTALVVGTAFGPLRLANADVNPKLECPPVLATKILADEHPGWSIYANDPLRLTGADILYAVDNEDATLNPDEVKELSDAQLSVVQIFRLRAHGDVKDPWFVCHYGLDAQLSRKLPRHATECRIVQRRQFGPEQSEFEASCW